MFLVAALDHQQLFDSFCHSTWIAVREGSMVAGSNLTARHSDSPVTIFRNSFFFTFFFQKILIEKKKQQLGKTNTLGVCLQKIKTFLANMLVVNRMLN